MSEDNIRQFSTEYRPKTLKNFICSDTLRLSLQNMVDNKSYPRVMLITGMTGTGKTSLAYILARAINGNLEDLVEMNMADSRGIDSIRNLAEMIKYKPLKNKYKIILLDEIQAVTTQAAAVLLKPLENLPSHCIAILCTDQPGKVLPTIQNRCTPINLTTPTPDMISKFLKKVCEKEGIDVPKEIRLEIGESCDGQVRKALQMLQLITGMLKGAKGKKLKEAIEQARSTILNADEDINIVKYLISLYTRNSLAASEVITNVTDWQGFIRKALEMHRFVMDNALKKEGKRCNHYYYTQNRGKLYEVISTKCKKTFLNDFPKVHSLLLDLFSELTEYTVSNPYHIFIARTNMWMLENSGE